ncbi:hypothetical protein NDU88_002931 [Pleurodeles waltl]|uniref:Uncharacterized protein n=1 Tax=Pleurodeles waltl TaxID=8319 RepID=A0AAV7SFY4_PLEWA|nr:hypothetical protein NDU88_002931 [Pleurodeles waltl]
MGPHRGPQEAGKAGPALGPSQNLVSCEGVQMGGLHCSVALLCVGRVSVQGRECVLMGRATSSLSASFAVSTPHLRKPADLLQGLSEYRVKQEMQAHCVGPTLQPHPSLWARPVPPQQHLTATTPQSCRGSREQIRDAV